jgi:uncharacterized membrane protein YozB (DUF420 family)
MLSIEALNPFYFQVKDMALKHRHAIVRMQWRISFRQAVVVIASSISAVLGFIMFGESLHTADLLHNVINAIGVILQLFLTILATVQLIERDDGQLHRHEIAYCELLSTLFHLNVMKRNKFMPKESLEYVSHDVARISMQFPLVDANMNLFTWKSNVPTPASSVAEEEV